MYVKSNDITYCSLCYSNFCFNLIFELVSAQTAMKIAFEYAKK